MTASPDWSYRRYAGGPDPLAPPVDLAEALAAIGDDVMAGYSPDRALSEVLRRGTPDLEGLDDLARKIATRRRDLLNRHNLDGTLQEVRELLDRAVLEERKQLARDLDDDARFAEIQIESLPESTAAAVSELANYPWRSPSAKADYEQIKDLLGRELLDQRFAGMKRALESASQDDRDAISHMLNDLNTLLSAHAAGQDTTAAFADFMAKHGHHFPENPRTVEELIDALAARAAAAQRLRNSMTPQQRAELDALAAQAFGSPELMNELNALDQNLRQLRPEAGWHSAEDFGGEQGLGLGDGTGVLQELAALDSAFEQLSQSYAGARLDDVDFDQLDRLLGPEAGVSARKLQELERALRESGMVRNNAEGALRLAPKAIRQLGKALLRDVATQMAAPGARENSHAGSAGDRTGATREWQFGDTDPWDVTASLTNAIRRTAAGGADPSRGVTLEIGDVEVIETQARTQAAVALLVDTSFSMAMDGRWVPMKRTALALHTLIQSRFRGDHLEMITFGRAARTMDIDELTGLAPRYAKGTNLHHGLLLANRHFRKHPNATPVLLIVTDGEPTAHLESSGEVYFEYPPHPVTLALTVRELDQAMRLGARTTFFRLGEDPGLERFIAGLAKRVGGTVSAPEAEDLGVAVVGSYLGSRAPRGAQWMS